MLRNNNIRGTTTGVVFKNGDAIFGGNGFVNPVIADALINDANAVQDGVVLSNGVGFALAVCSDKSPAITSLGREGRGGRSGLPSRRPGYRYR